ncbi:MAG: hypothetical protein RhofKO_37930 [Rhodothermales bacterium]
MSDETLHLVERLRRRLHTTLRRMTLAQLLAGLLLCAGVLTGLWLVASAAEARFWMGTTPRSIIFWLVAATAVGLLGYFFVIPLLRLVGLLPSPAEEEVAKQIGTHYPEVSDRLVNILDLTSGRASGAASPLVDSAVSQLGREVAPVRFEEMEQFDDAKRVGRLAIMPMLGLAAFWVVAPVTFLDASKRLLSPTSTFQPPAPFALTLSPGDVELVKGESLTITVEAQGTTLPTELTLRLNQSEEEVVEEVRLTADSLGVFRHTLVNVRNDLRYAATADPVETTWYAVDVTERPIVRGVQVNLTFPRYTGIPPQRLDPNVGDITALRGTQVSIEVGVGGEAVEAAMLVFDDEREEPLTLEDMTATGSFGLYGAGRYHIALENAQGLRNSDPIPYTLTPIADGAPTIVLLAPEDNAVLTDDLSTGLRIRMTDDFGFARLRLYYRLAESQFGNASEEFATLDLPLTALRTLDQEVLKTWDLDGESGLGLVPGDVVEYYVQVWDNDQVSGLKSARTATRRLRLPSLAEQYEQLDEQQDETEDELTDLQDEAQQIRDDFEELRDELRQKQEADWEDERLIEQLKERQQSMEERVENLSSQVEEMRQQMEDNNLVSDETLDLYEDLQRTMEEINSPELQEALQQLQDAMQNMDLQQMQESIQQFEFNEQQYQKRLDNALQLFKQMRTQQDLEELSRRAEDLAKQEERLAEKTEERLEEQQTGNDLDEDTDSEEGDEQPEGEQQAGEQQEGEQQTGEQQEGQQAEDEQEEREQQAGEQQEGEQQAGEQQEGEQQNGEQEGANEDLAQEQERIKEQMQELLEKMQETRQNMEGVKNTPQDQMQQMQQNAEQLPQDMEENAEQLRQDELQDAQQGQQQMQQQLQQMQQQMQDMQQGMQGAQMNINMAGLRRALEDVLILSERQERLRQDVRGLTADSPALRPLTREQSELTQGLTMVADSLSSLSADIPQMSRALSDEASNALQAMSRTMNALTDQSVPQAASYQRESMTHLNELALLLSDLMDQLQNQNSSGQGGSQSMQQMMQQMQQMSQQQGQLNQQIQQMLNDMAGNRMSQNAGERIQQMAQQQEMLRRQLREMNRNPELRGKMLGDLNQIAEQMAETIEDLQRGRPNRQTLERQRQILTRMLNAQQSMQQRGRENKREGQQGRDRSRSGPGDLPPAEQADQLRRALIKALESGYSPDYQELIKRYFDLLQEQE